MENTLIEPVTGFAALQLGSELERGVTALGFSEPRPIQARTIPAILAGRDVLGLAQTGTGKTAAFALPALARLRRAPRRGPRVLIVAPTRELASQIAEEIRALARFTSIRVAVVFGGVSEVRQRAELESRPEILVACPGRLLDLHGKGAVRLDEVTMLVLDEADHMFDMGFLPDIRRILAALPDRRQNLMFSATMPPAIRDLADRVLRDPEVIDLTRSVEPLAIRHALYTVDEPAKRELLERVLREDGCTSAIVFTRTKHRARRLAQQLERSGHRVVALQGNMSQGARQRAMDGFRDRRYEVLVATDIVARGIDVERVSHVVNFDMPGTVEAYTHRIGRTGRAQCEGTAYTFVTAADDSLVRAVERRLGKSIPRRSVPGLSAVAAPTTSSRTPVARYQARGRRR